MSKTCNHKNTKILFNYIYIYLYTVELRVQRVCFFTRGPSILTIMNWYVSISRIDLQWGIIYHYEWITGIGRYLTTPMHQSSSVSTAHYFVLGVWRIFTITSDQNDHHYPLWSICFVWFLLFPGFFIVNPYPAWFIINHHVCWPLCRSIIVIYH